MKRPSLQKARCSSNTAYSRSHHVDHKPQNEAGCPLPPRMWQDEDHLGELALKFRGTRRAADRQAIAGQYAQTVDRLIQGGTWQEMPGPEDQLPTPGCLEPSSNTGQAGRP